ncbi:helix-turn-helix transcriptional regulator [Roseiconus lacunae]|uniref:WYL domain-containing transcriptional regulator n=1 Tax=Roseiconus lacunae TaxID=2605694 RepID=A0ABT7PFI8_9BACT|nr:WYL domain-containing transcriptional regulator [Roseiconus lacunae]MCD0462740.1 transcriptional regulator [Roseiconus lacunae]MDM4015254.1 WYL domain-containing transcriptional regulator [Roseiconus lacunae]WRQ49977.1 WYL domain-containing transcriptional regulator [Stieleria sp. HD01]
MARNEQLIRQHKLLQLLELSRFGRTLDELRGDLVADLGLTKLHERTVRRDLEALQAAGFDIQSETVQRGRVFKLGQNTKDVHEIGISSTELIALSIGRELLYPLMGTQYWRGIETFWNKVQEAVPNGVFDHYARYRAALHVFGSPYKSYERQEGMLKTINRAILEHRLVEIDYQAIGKPVSTRRIEPYGLAVYQSSIYIVAATPQAEGDVAAAEKNARLRNWKLDRFRQARLLDEYFKPDSEIDLAKYLGSSIGIFSGDSPTKVQIKLGKRSAAYVREDPWHPEQVLEELDDEAAMLTVPASHPREILPRVLSLGADAEVIGPEEFRETVAEAVRTMAEAYR